MSEKEFIIILLNRKMEKYNPKEIEKKWQEKWEKSDINKAVDFDKRPKYYALLEFPYPSGAGMHIGHTRNDSMMDVMVRLRRMKGYNVLFPIGWDAFGLPTENYALKTNRNPAEVTKENTDNFLRQMKSLGLSFDYDRIVDTTDPKYYKWTQWIFLKLLEKGLAYKAEMPINWCPKCKVGCANEEVIGGVHERCNTPVETKNLSQWVLKITEYADRLYDDLDYVDYLESIKISQRNWIGRKPWIDIEMQVVMPVQDQTVSNNTDETPDIESNNIYKDKVKIADGLRLLDRKSDDSDFKRIEDVKITIATSRPDTNFGATFVVLAPDCDYVEHLKKYMSSETISRVEEYSLQTSKKTQADRISEGRKKTGVFTGLYTINPLNNEKLPIFLADFVMKDVGTGAVIGVPGHDRRDYEFSQVYDLPVIRVVKTLDGKDSEIESIDDVQEAEGIMMNSGFLDGMEIHDAIPAVMDYLESKGVGKKVIRYNLHDWNFSRQRYWGEPIPVVFCDKCGTVPLPEEQLPLTLPEMSKYELTEDGTSQLSKVSEWVNTSCPKCGGPAKRETDTMPNWAGSSWYFMRYCDPNNDQALADKDKLDYWMPVDFYEGGSEHINLHLLYSRFWYKFLGDIGYASNNRLSDEEAKKILESGKIKERHQEVLKGREPYLARAIHGIVLGEGGVKMSKSLGNVINPDNLIAEYGADVTRAYMLFMGPYDATCEWSDRTIIGIRRWVTRMWNYISKQIDGLPTDNDNTTAPILNNTAGNYEDGLEKSDKISDMGLVVKQLAYEVEEDILGLKFNTAISLIMKFINEHEEDLLNYDSVLDLIKIMAPITPHLAEELWFQAGQPFSVHNSEWVKYNVSDFKKSTVVIPVQFNGKVRGRIEINVDADEQSVIDSILADSSLNRNLPEGKYKKVIFVPNKIINIIV